MVRYLTSVLFFVLMTVYLMFVMVSCQLLFQRLIYLHSKLITPSFDARVLDGRVSFSCSESKGYSFSNIPDDLNILAFYQITLGNQ